VHKGKGKERGVVLPACERLEEVKGELNLQRPCSLKLLDLLFSISKLSGKGRKSKPSCIFLAQMCEGGKAKKENSYRVIEIRKDRKRGPVVRGRSV